MSFSKYFAVVSILGTLTLSAPARADIPPDDECQESDEGKACHNAIVDDSPPTQTGTCQKTMCTRMTPDGPLTYECHRCVASEPGAGGQSNEGGSSPGAAGNPGAAGGSGAGGSASGSSAGKSSAAGTTSTAGKPADPPEDDGDSEEAGCSVSPAAGGAGTMGTSLLVLGLAVARIFRRRSQAS